MPDQSYADILREVQAKYATPPQGSAPVPQASPSAPPPPSQPSAEKSYADIMREVQAKYGAPAPPPPDTSSFLSKAASGVGKVMGAAAYPFDALARAVMRAQSTNPNAVPDTMTRADMLNEAAGLSRQQAGSDYGFGHELAGTALKFVAGAALDPVVQMMPGVGSLARGSTVAKGILEAVPGLDAVASAGAGAEQYPTIAKALEAAQAAGRVAVPINRALPPIFAGTMAANLAQAVPQGYEEYQQKGFTPEVAGHLLETGLTAGTLGMMAHGYMGEREAAQTKAGIETERANQAEMARAAEAQRTEDAQKAAEASAPRAPWAGEVSRTGMPIQADIFPPTGTIRGDVPVIPGVTASGMPPAADIFPPATTVRGEVPIAPIPATSGVPTAANVFPPTLDRVRVPIPPQTLEPTPAATSLRVTPATTASGTGANIAELPATPENVAPSARASQAQADAEMLARLIEERKAKLAANVAAEEAAKKGEANAAPVVDVGRGGQAVAGVGAEGAGAEAGRGAGEENANAAAEASQLERDKQKQQYAHELLAKEEAKTTAPPAAEPPNPPQTVPAFADFVRSKGAEWPIDPTSSQGRDLRTQYEALKREVYQPGTGKPVEMTPEQAQTARDMGLTPKNVAGERFALSEPEPLTAVSPASERLQEQTGREQMRPEDREAAAKAEESSKRLGRQLGMERYATQEGGRDVPPIEASQEMFRRTRPLEDYPPDLPSPQMAEAARRAGWKVQQRGDGLFITESPDGRRFESSTAGDAWGTASDIYQRNISSARARMRVIPGRKLEDRTKFNSAKTEATAEAPATKPVDANRVRYAFPGAKVTDNGDGSYLVEHPGGEPIHVRVEPDGITWSEKDIAPAHGEQKAEAVAKGERFVAGVSRRVDGKSLIALDPRSEDGILLHEIVHKAKDRTPEERGVVQRFRDAFAFVKRFALTADEREKMYAKNEGAARAAAEAEGVKWDGLAPEQRQLRTEEFEGDDYARWFKDRKTPNSWYSKILAYAKRVYSTFRPTWESAYERIARGETFMGEEGRGGERGGERFATAPAPIPPGGAAAPVQTAYGVYGEGPPETTSQGFVRMVVDQFNRGKTVMGEIARRGGNVASNFVEKMEAYRPRAAGRVEEFRVKEVQPIVNILHRDDLSMQDEGKYLWAKHAPDRNALILQRDPQNPAGSGMTNAEAAQVLADFNARGLTPKLEAVAQRVYRVMAQQRALMVKYGLASADQVRQWEQDFGPYYVPLKMEEVGRGPHIGMGFSIAGKESKSALGYQPQFGKTPENPLGYALAQTMETIVRGEKNRAGQSFLKFVRDNQNLLGWKIDTYDQSRTLDKNGLVVEKPDVLAKILDREHYVQVKEGGRQHFIKVDDPLMARAMTNMSPQQMGAVAKYLGKATRLYSSLQTSLSPEFLFMNPTRDVQQVLGNLASMGKMKALKDVVKNVPFAMRAAWQAERDPTATGPWVDAYREMRRHGGATGFFDMQTGADLNSEIEKMMSLKGPGAKNAWMRSFGTIKKVVEDANAAGEAATRLSVYKAMRDSGLSAEDAAHVSRNVSVNFSRHGELGPLVNSAYAFANASAQGTARMIEALSGKNGRKVAAGAVIAGYLLDRAARGAMDDEDKDGRNDYDQIKNFVKERNWIIPRQLLGMGPGKPFMIPMPYGYNVLHHMGQQIASWQDGVTTPQQSARAVVSSAVSAFNPIGGEEDFAQQITPTLLDPIVQISENKDWTGRPIWPEPGFGQIKPESQKAFKTVNPQLKALAEGINAATGGDKYTSGAIDISPEVIEHLLKFVTGALGRTAMQSLTAVQTLAGGELPSVRETPLLRRYMYEEHPSEQSITFRENTNDLDALWQRYNGYKKDGNRAAIQQLPQSMLRLKPVIDEYRNRIRKLSQADPEKFADQIKTLETAANARIAAARKKEGIPSMAAAQD